MNNKTTQLGLQLRATLRILAANTTLSDSQMMQIPDMYPIWDGNSPVSLTKGDIVKWGVNEWGEPQLYRVVTAHVTQAELVPDESPSLFQAIGFAPDNTPIWTQPLGAHDCYEKDDEVSHKGARWGSIVDNNVWEPGVCGWAKK